MVASSIDRLRESLMGVTVVDPAYAAKQLHAIPAAPVVDRSAFILERVTGKNVLEFGASGPMHEAIVKAARHVVGVDRQNGPDVIGVDLDDVGLVTLPDVRKPAVDVIVCGEVIEHLSNPGWFLTRLRRQYSGVPVIITVPNAFSDGGRKFVAKGIENINLDHVAWYSWKTLTVLLARHGYTVKAFAWYNGQPRIAEGLIVVTE